MLLDTSSINLILENFGNTLNSLITISNVMSTNNYSLIYEFFYNYVNLLHVWPTEDEMISTQNNVLFTYYYYDSYINMIKEIYYFYPSLYAFDYLHCFLLKQVVYRSYLSLYENSFLVVSKPVSLYLNTNFLINFVFTKWSYGIICFFLSYIFSNIVKFRLQYGFNFYFNYFKLLSDLGEQEYGSYDDFKFFLFILIQMLIWYCWIFFIGYTFSLQSESKLILLTLSIMITILTIPVRLLWDFGLSFAMYVRGAASSKNLLVEAFFDIIGVIIIFTRFIVQNIRFLMVFVAYFELFEWVFGANQVNFILNYNLNYISNTNLFSTINTTSIITLVICSFKVIIIYLYHLLHLIIVSFMQIGVYLMVSFWLFFFLYTSFFKLTSDNYFSSKRF